MYIRVSSSLSKKVLQETDKVIYRGCVAPKNTQVHDIVEKINCLFFFLWLFNKKKLFRNRSLIKIPLEISFTFFEAPRLGWPPDDVHDEGEECEGRRQERVLIEELDHVVQSSIPGYQICTFIRTFLIFKLTKIYIHQIHLKAWGWGLWNLVTREKLP